MPPSKNRNHQDVTDISNPQQLMSYATAGQLEQVVRQRRDFSDRKIAHAARLGGTADLAASALSKALVEGPKPEQLSKLDEIIGALVPELEDTGGLCSLALRLYPKSQEDIRTSMIARVPPSWTRKILGNAPDDELGVLIQASALLAAFQAAERTDQTAGVGAGDRSVAAIRDRYRGEIPPLVQRLLVVSDGPPSPRNIDAQVMLGSLATYSFDLMRPIIEREIRHSPLGFRTWRAMTKVVKISPESGRAADELLACVRPLLESSEQLRKKSVYPGRSLDLELAAIVPRAWSPAGNDWVARVLLSRARNKDATVRERGTAAMALAARLYPDPGGAATDMEIQAELGNLVTEFKDPDARPDARAGLEWIAATLKQAMNDRVPVCNTWPPQVNAPWLEHVEEATDSLDTMGIPDRLLDGTKSLFKHMILQNAGAYRRQAIETVSTSGWHGPIVQALGKLLELEKDESWIRIRALFALGFIQRQNELKLIEEDLFNACEEAYDKLALARGSASREEPTESHITEMHTALFAVGDCFGVQGAEDSARRAISRLDRVLTGLSSPDGDKAKRLHRATRAAAYLLTVCAQPGTKDEPDLSEKLLRQLGDSPDLETRRLSEWALGFRWDENRAVRPLLAAVKNQG
jgi:hypothetical protein